jgi:hypothetical protein
MLTLPLKLAGPVIAKPGEVMSAPVQIAAMAELIPPSTPHVVEYELEVLERSRLPLACTTTFPADSKML